MATLQRSDYDQAGRYLQRACELMERGAAAQTRGLRGILEQAIRRLSPGDHFVGDAAAEINVLGSLAQKFPIPDARTEVLKAVAVLRDRS
jgi:hypothetical protein